MDSEDSKVILGELCALAPSMEVRDCLRLYKPKASYKHLEKIFLHCSVGHISESLVYLNAHTSIPLSDLTKDGLVRKLILRMHNLMPETCEFCNNTYAVAKDTPPLLPCKGCGQDVHMDCLASKLNLANDNLVLDNIIAVVNPLCVPGLTYLCHTCKVTAIESEDIYLKQSALKKRTQNPPTSSSSTVSESIQSTAPQTDSNSISNSEENTQAEPTSGDDSATSQVASLSPNLATIGASSSSHGVAQPEISNQEEQPQSGSSVAQPYPAELQSGSSGSQLSVPPSDPKSFPNICPDFLAFKCKRRSQCLLDHPKVCYNFIDHGHKDPYGCDGRKCTELHPPMCKESLKDMKCFNQDCQLWHLRGTIRKKRSEINTEESSSAAPERTPAPTKKPTSKNSKHQASKSEASTSSPSQNVSSENNASFLEEVRLLKSEIQEVMDLRFATHKSELSPESEAREC